MTIRLFGCEGEEQFWFKLRHGLDWTVRLRTVYCSRELSVGDLAGSTDCKNTKAENVASLDAENYPALLAG